MPSRSAPTRFFLKGQMVHLLVLMALLVVAYLLVDMKQLRDSRFLGVSAHGWFIIALAVPISHQVYVWLAWRSELCIGAVTSRLGSDAFVIYQIVFLSSSWSARSA